MAFKMKGMGFGEGTGYKSPQLKKAEAEAAGSPNKVIVNPVTTGLAAYGAYKGYQAVKDWWTGGDKKKEEPKKQEGGGWASKVVDKAKETKAKADAQKKAKDDKWKSGQEASGGKLDPWVKERSKHKKGSPEYNALQNKINKSLGSEKRHGVTTETKSGKGGKVEQTATKTPGLSEKKETTQKRSATRGNVRVTEEKDLETGKTTTTSKRGKSVVGGPKVSETKTDASGRVTSRTKEKYGKKETGEGDTGDWWSGRRKKSKTKTYNEDGTVTITKKKAGKEEKTKTRKQRLRGVGEKLGVGKGDIRKQRRIDRRANK